MWKVGLIGCGSIAKVHGWVLSAKEDGKIVAACDIVRERAEAFMREFGQEENSADASDSMGQEAKGVYTDWKELLTKDIDVIHICTPHYLHAPMATEFLRRGKAVFMEKPCAINRKQFEELTREDESHPGKLGFCFQNRYNVTTQKLDELVGGGAIGSVTGARAFVTWRRDLGYYGSPWKGKWDTEGGGALINQSIHTLDLMLRYLGKPVSVTASMHNHHLQGVIEVEDTVEAWMTFDQGERACFYASNAYATDAPVLLEIQGSKGRITMNGSDIMLWTEKGQSEHFFCEEKLGIGKSYWGSGHRACIQDFYDSLSEKRSFSVGLESVKKTFEVMMGIYEAAGAPIVQG